MAAIQCRDCISGTIHTGKPTGVQILFHGLPTYVTRPDEGEPEKGIIIFIPDIFGWKFANSRLLADKYAKKGGYTVYLPDFMGGQSIPHPLLQLLLFTLYRQELELPLRPLMLCASPPPIASPPRCSTPSSSSHSISSHLSSSSRGQLSIPDGRSLNQSCLTS